MTNELYEYRDENNWYVATWSDFAYLTYAFENEEELYDFVSPLQRLAHEGGIKIQIFQHASDFRLIEFILGIINKHEKRELKVVQKAGAYLITEGDALRLVQLPKQGVDLAAFFDGQDLKETLLIATRNEGKTKEFRQIFEKLGFEVENLNAHPELPEVAETGLTFEENARLKAETISQLTGKMVLADDSGLMVDILGGLPGVWSARFSGPDATDEKNNAKLLHELAMVFEKKDRSAHFHTTLVIAAPGKESLVVEADWPGHIAFAPQGENGFGYDPLFLVGDSDQSAAQLSLEEKNQQSHRALAVKKLVEVFPEWQNKPSS